MAPDPLTAIAFVAFFILLTLITMRRPAFGACGLILIQPFALYQDAFSTTVTLPKVALIAVLLGLSTRAGIFRPLVENGPLRLVCAGLLVAVATAISYAQAAHHAPVIRETLKAVEYVLTFAAVFAAFREDPDRRLFRNTALLLTVAVSLASLAQEVIGSPSGLLINGHITPRVSGPLEGPNQLAGFFDVALPLALALAIDEPSSLAYAALFFAACADILTFSGAGVLAALAGVIVASFVLHRNLGRPLAYAVLGAAAGAVLIWTFAAHLPLLSLFGRETSTYGGNLPQLWHTAIVSWRQHPLLGIGAGNFEPHANSLYLQSLVEGGIPLLLATLWLVYTCIATFWNERTQSPFVAAAFAGSIALALHQTVDFLTFYPKVGGWWWIVLALGAAELTARASVRAKAGVPAYA